LTLDAVVRPGRPPLDAEADVVARLKSVVAAHGFLGPPAREALGPEIGRAHLRADLPLHIRGLAAPTPLNTLVKLFSLDQSVGEEAAAAALAPVSLEDLAACGLIGCEERGVRALVGLAAHGDLLLAHDRLQPDRSALAPDHVLGKSCDGRRPLAEAVDELAKGSGTDPARLSAVVAEAARKLAALGLLVPTEDEEGRVPTGKDV
jgi:hypothetical protein